MVTGDPLGLNKLLEKHVTHSIKHPLVQPCKVFRQEIFVRFHYLIWVYTHTHTDTDIPPLKKLLKLKGISCFEIEHIVSQMCHPWSSNHIIYGSVWVFTEIHSQSMELAGRPERAPHGRKTQRNQRQSAFFSCQMVPPSWGEGSNKINEWAGEAQFGTPQRVMAWKYSLAHFKSTKYTQGQTSGALIVTDFMKRLFPLPKRCTLGFL